MRTFLLFKVLLLTSVMAGCASAPREPELDQSQYCHTTSKYELDNGSTVNSNILVECTDKPKINHFLKDAGVASQCRPYKTVVTIRGRQKNVQGFLCKYADGSWQAVDGRYAY